jgi:hypothetical protein
MKFVPNEIDGATVILYSPIDERHRPTGNCKQILAGVLVGPAAGLAICRYDGNEGFYLFGCDANWNSVTDTLHVSVEEAKAQAEFEYEGVGNTWQKKMKSHDV